MIEKLVSLTLTILLCLPMLTTIPNTIDGDAPETTIVTDSGTIDEKEPNGSLTPTDPLDPNAPGESDEIVG